jgi:hypothetical protein
MEYQSHGSHAMLPGGESISARGLGAIPEHQHEGLSQTIYLAIWRRTSGRIHDLRVRWKPDRVVLGGHCSTYYCKQLATHAALELTSDAVLVNDIEVCSEGEA